MRDQGRLVEWLDDKGYGFIQPNDLSKPRVFLHIKDFAQRGPRPILGCALDYVVIVDERGRFRAKQVVYLKAKQSQPSHQPQTRAAASSLHPIVIVMVIYALFLLLAVGLKALPSGLLLYILLILNSISLHFN
jgi:cold shock CspA family protein